MPLEIKAWILGSSGNDHTMHVSHTSFSHSCSPPLSKRSPVSSRLISFVLKSNIENIFYEVEGMDGIVLEKCF